VPDPLVSVIVGAYNHAEYVRECLDSIIAGDYRDVELVVFNDASPDASGAVIEQWGHEHPQIRMTFLNHSQNLGFTRSLNEAFRQASGEYVGVIAADDVMLPNGIVDRVQYLDRHPDKLAVFADSHVIDASGQIIEESAIEGYFRHHGMRKNLLQVDELMPYNIVFHWSVPGPVFLCRRSTLDIVGQYDEHSVAEDFDLYLRLAAAGKLGFCDSYVASYRKHDQSMTRKQYDAIQMFLAEAGYKNRGLFGPICRLRLVANWYGMRACQEIRPFRRQLLLAAHRALLLISWRTYLMRRKLILRNTRTRADFC
jgi:glycosyltransferase involved in cell wall biosynthesis